MRREFIDAQVVRVVTGVELIRSPIGGYDPDNIEDIEAAMRMANFINVVIKFNTDFAVMYPEISPDAQYAMALACAKIVSPWETPCPSP